MIIARFAGAPQLTLYLHGGLAFWVVTGTSLSNLTLCFRFTRKCLLEHHSQVEAAADIYI